MVLIVSVDSQAVGIVEVGIGELVLFPLLVAQLDGGLFDILVGG